MALSGFRSMCATVNFTYTPSFEYSTKNSYALFKDTKDDSILNFYSRLLIFL